VRAPPTTDTHAPATSTADARSGSASRSAGVCHHAEHPDRLSSATKESVWALTTRESSSRPTTSPETMDGLVDYYRRIGGEHADWDDYRRAMEHQRRVLVRVSIDTVGPTRAG
jgi:hypothetical protein